MFNPTDIARLTSAESLFDYNFYEFEYACKYLLEITGRFPHVFVTRKGPKGGDGGVDLEIKDTNRKMVGYGQCKQWHTRYKGLIQSIRALAGCMSRDKVAKGILLVTVKATQYEQNEAARCGIEIIDSPLLENMIQQANAVCPFPPVQSHVTSQTAG